jgi:CheY-like chemotaxis protein
MMMSPAPAGKTDSAGEPCLFLAQPGPSPIDGVELARRVRADGRFAGLRLLLNSSAGAGDLAGQQKLDFDAFEEKPVLPRVLIGALCELIGEEPLAAVERTEDVA